MRERDFISGFAPTLFCTNCRVSRNRLWIMVCGSDSGRSAGPISSDRLWERPTVEAEEEDNEWGRKESLAFSEYKFNSHIICSVV